MPTEVKSKRPPTPRKKSLSLDAISKSVKKMNTYSEYMYDREQNIVIKYYEEFNEKKIQELFQDLIAQAEYAMKTEYNYLVNDQEVYDYIGFLIIKHFSEYKDKIGNDFEKNMHVFDEMVQKGIYHLFYSDVFNPEEVAKVYDRYHERIELASKHIELNPELQQQLANLQNKDIIFNKSKIVPEA